MPTLKNKHLLWAASLCSAGGVLLGLSDLLDRSRTATELDRLRMELRRTESEARQALVSQMDSLKMELNQTESKARQALQALASQTDNSLKEVRESVNQLKVAEGADKKRLGDLSRSVENTTGDVAKIKSAMSKRGGDLKLLSDALTPLQRIEEQLKRIADQQQKLMQRPRPDPRVNAGANDNKADPETRRPENEPGTP